jgi:hypothetical protein
LLVTFSLEGKSNQKVQGKSAGGRTGSDRSARFSEPAHGKSQWMNIIFFSGRLP